MAKNIGSVDFFSRLCFWSLLSGATGFHFRWIRWYHPFEWPGFGTNFRKLSVFRCLKISWSLKHDLNTMEKCVYIYIYECSLALADTLFSDKGTVRICAWRHVGVAAAKTSVKNVDHQGIIKGSCIAAMPPTKGGRLRANKICSTGKFMPPMNVPWLSQTLFSLTRAL